MGRWPRRNAKLLLVHPARDQAPRALSECEAEKHPGRALSRGGWVVEEAHLIPHDKGLAVTTAPTH